MESGLTLFYLENCPYCRHARRALEALRSERAEYAAVPVEWVEETRSPERVRGLDYYYVPSAFLGRRKLYECHPGDGYEAVLAGLRQALDAAVAEA